MRRRLPRRDGKQKRKRKTTATNKTSKKNLNSPPQKNISHFSDSHKHSSLAFVHLLSFLTNPFYIIQQGREIREQGERRAILNINHELSLLFFFTSFFHLFLCCWAHRNNVFILSFLNNKTHRRLPRRPRGLVRERKNAKQKKHLKSFLRRKKKLSVNQARKP